MKLKRSKKGVEMTLNVVVLVVIILVTVGILIYIMVSKSKTFTGSVSCPAEECKTTAEGCDSGKEFGLMACSKQTSDGKSTVVGRCCVKSGT